MWGELNLEDRCLIVEPLKWNDDDLEYKFDTDAGQNKNRVEGRDGFIFPLPGPASQTTSTMAAPVVAESQSYEFLDSETHDLPEGWRIVDREALANITAERPDTQTMANYFDGSLPSWRVALAEGVQPRQIVEDIAARFRERHDEASKPLVRLLTGAGGEGKSTALLQIAAALVRDEAQDWTCLHRVATAAEVAPNLFERLEQRDGHAWIVALDDAENAGKELAAALKHIGARTDIHLVLAAREADWRIRALQRDLWHGIAEFHRDAMPGLDEKDALRIASGWQAYGNEAMGRLRGTSVEGAAKALFGHANEHAARPGAGALLGALLFTRQGEDLKDRVRTFLAPLKGRREIERFDLLDVYAMIAAMHAENQLYLSRAVLAFALDCDEATLDRQLRILQQEAMLDSGETYLLTRHRRIAEAAHDALQDDGYDLKRWYAYLAGAALREFRVRRSGNPDIAKWNFGLADHFVSLGEANWPVARNVAKARFEAQKDDAMGLTFFARVLRQTNVPGDAMALLKAKGEQFKTHRGVLYEWSVVAGEIGDSGLNVWLAARSLADGGGPPTKKNCKLSLSGLGRGFELLREETGQAGFTRAQAACGRLGLCLPDLDATARGYFERHAGVEADAARPQPTEDEDLQTLRNVVIVAAEEVEPDNDPVFFERLLGEPDGYRYAGLKRVIDDETPARRRAAAS